MSEIVVLSDSADVQEVEKSLIFFTIPMKEKVWSIKVKFPEGNVIRYRYASQSVNTSYDLGPKAFDRRRDIIQERVIELSKLGYSAGQKYISLFMSKKIKELILTKNVRSSRRSEEGSRISRGGRSNELERVKAESAKRLIAIEKEKLRRLREISEALGITDDKL